MVNVLIVLREQRPRVVGTFFVNLGKLDRNRAV
jgi:hypothetical protein